MDAIQEITIEQLDPYHELLILDIRSEIAFRHGHIPGAVSFPEPFDLELLRKTILSAPEKETVLYCSIGTRSQMIAEELLDSDIHVYNLKGGFRAWLLKHASVFCQEEREQYSRQMVLPEIGQYGQEKLKNAKVLVIGAGALGCSALTYLAAAGIGTIGIVEGDTVERSNLHRQTLFSVSDIGRKKVQAARERLLQMNDFIQIQTFDLFATPENITGLIRDYDFVIDATDSIEIKFMINDACVLQTIPFCHAGIVGFAGQLMTWVPGNHSCYRCVFEEIPEGYVPNCAQAGIMGAMAGMVGSIQALEAIKYITGTGELLVDKVLHIDGTDMETITIPIPHKNPGCKVCGQAAVIQNVAENAYAYRRRGCSI